MFTKPNQDALPAYYRPYILALPEDNIQEAITTSFQRFLKKIENLSLDQLDYSYGEEKWTIRQIILHMIDCERIMTYRALRFSRGDRTELVGFDQNIYVEAPGLKKRSLQDLIDEWKTVHQSTLSLFNGLTDAELKREGIANGYVMSAGSIGFVIAGHVYHHLNVLKERYFAAPDFPA